MNIKKGVIFLFCIILLSSLVIAEDYVLGVSIAKEIFEAGENITFKVDIYDSNNNLIDDAVSVTLEDAEERIFIKQTIPSNEFIEVNLGKLASYGQGKIIAEYKNSKATGLFEIKIKELARFDLNEDTLTITNVGNTRYTKTIHIIIGETTGIKNPKINIGKSISYKLIAPKGVYLIKITDGKTTFIKEEVILTGTGKIIGALDERISKGNSITGGISPDEEDGISRSYLKNNKFTYVFILAIFGATILLAIERNYKKKLAG